MNFQKWLESSYSKIDGGEELVIEMADLKITFDQEINTLEDLESEIDKSGASDDLKASLKKRIKKPWHEFQKEEHFAPQLSELSSLSQLCKFLPIVGILLIAVLILFVFYKAFFGANDFLNKISSIEFMRGIITFLFALGTIGIAIIMTVTVYASSNKDKDDRKERFYRAKEILTILIGILGTIVGFYFGAPIDSEKQIEKIKLSELVISASPLVIGEPFTITTLAQGGVPPYRYTMRLMDGLETIIEHKNKKSQDGLITNSFRIEKEKEGYNITAKLIVEDNKSQSANLVSNKIKIKKKE